MPRRNCHSMSGNLATGKRLISFNFRDYLPPHRESLIIKMSILHLLYFLLLNRDDNGDDQNFRAVSTFVCIPQAFVGSKSGNSYMVYR